ncbi:MAG: phosphoglycolate phosphatase [Steroidobacteraceae bacterium]
MSATDAGTFAAGIRALLFDLDGTLLDTAGDLSHALNELLAREGRAPLDPARIRCHVSQGASALVRLGFPHATDAEFQALRGGLLAIYRGALAVHTRPFEGIPELLDHLERHGMPWGVVTNKPYAFAVPLLEALGLARRAAVIVGGDTLPEHKPHPRPLLHAAERIGVTPAETAYVGDARGDMLAARAAGMRAVAACFGYLQPGENPREWPADAWIDSPREILDWLRSGAPAAPAPTAATPGAPAAPASSVVATPA